MNRGQIIENYLELSRKAQEVEYYWETGVATDAEFDEARSRALDYYHNNELTRQELTDYNDRRRNAVKTSSINEARAALNNFFSA